MQFERLTGMRNKVNRIRSTTEARIPEIIAVSGMVGEISFPRIELDMLCPASTRPDRTPARVRKRANL